MAEQKIWQIILEIALLSVAAGFGLFVWVYVGADDLAAYWEWQWRPYVELWENYDIGGFFRDEGSAYALLLYLTIGVFVLFLSFRLSVWIAKAMIAFTLAKTVLSIHGALQITPPSTPLIAAAFAGALWLVVSRFLAKANWRQLWQGKPFGDARWASWWELRKAGLTEKGGLFLGRARGRDLYHNDEGHIITIGGTGGGKSAGLVVPALLELTQGSVIVTDPSGELTAMTMRHRAEIGRVVLLNPFQSTFEEATGLDYPDTGFNPMSIIDPTNPNFKSDVDTLARYLMVTDRKESSSYWNDEGKTFLSLVIAATVLYEDKDLHNLSFVYERVRDRAEALEWWLGDVIDHGHPALKSEAEGYLDIIKTAPQQWQGIIRKAASATARYAPSTPLGEHVKKNGFDAADLKRENVTVYLLVPSGQLAVALPWMNTLIGVFGIAVGRPGAARPVTLLVDEAPSLGYLPDLLPFMGQFRKAGLRVWIFTQTAAQLASDELYGQTGFKAMMGLCSIKQFFSIREPEVEKMVSDMCGQKSADNVTENTRGESVGSVGVPLIRPEKVRGLRKWRQIIVIDALDNPIKAKLVPYFKRKAWNEMADKNPYRSK
jgi:type IV secretion system protein VirD4